MQTNQLRWIGQYIRADNTHTTTHGHDTADTHIRTHAPTHTHRHSDTDDNTSTATLHNTPRHQNICELVKCIITVVYVFINRIVKEGAVVVVLLCTRLLHTLSLVHIIARPDEVVGENIDSIRSMHVCMQLVVGPVNGSINNSISFKNYILSIIFLSFSR